MILIYYVAAHLTPFICIQRTLLLGGNDVNAGLISYWLATKDIYRFVILIIELL